MAASNPEDEKCETKKTSHLHPDSPRKEIIRLNKLSDDGVYIVTCQTPVALRYFLFITLAQTPSKFKIFDLVLRFRLPKPLILDDEINMQFLEYAYIIQEWKELQDIAHNIDIHPLVDVRMHVRTILLESHNRKLEYDVKCKFTLYDLFETISKFFDPKTYRGFGIVGMRVHCFTPKFFNFRDKSQNHEEIARMVSMFMYDNTQRVYFQNVDFVDNPHDNPRDKILELDSVHDILILKPQFDTIPRKRKRTSFANIIDIVSIKPEWFKNRINHIRKPYCITGNGCTSVVRGGGAKWCFYNY